MHSPFCSRKPAADLTGPNVFAAAAAVVRTGADLAPAVDAVLGAARRAGYTERELFGLRMALEEAVVNSLKHAHNYDPSKKVRVRCRVDAAEVLAEVEDEGPGFCPAGVADPLAEANLARDCGRGLMLMRHYMSEVCYNAAGNCVTMRLRRAAGKCG
jgi:serine/threonine-protein kinase RsbW